MSLSSQQKRNRIKYSKTENSVGWQLIIWPFLNAKAGKSSLVVSPGKAEQDLFLKDFYEDLYIYYGFLAASVVKKKKKKSTYNAGIEGAIRGSGRFSGEGKSNPLQYSCLRNSMDREAWQAIVQRVTRVSCDLATKPPPKICLLCFILKWIHQGDV